MPEYLAPGVYIEEVPTRATPIEGVSTSTAGFIGPVAKARARGLRMVKSFREYAKIFGGIRDMGPSVTGDALPLAVQAFFANGGTRACIVPLDGRGSVRARYARALAALHPRREVAVLCLPGVAAGTPLGAAILPLAVAAVEKLQSRMLIVDPPPDVVLKSLTDVGRLGLPASSLAAFYYPWVKVTNPHGGTTGRSRRPATVLAPPCGFAAGLWARTDAARGVWSAPAGTAAVVRGAVGVGHEVAAADLERLSPRGVNGLRMLPTGLTIWGARTLAPLEAWEWTYVNVRRLAIFIERSVALRMRGAIRQRNAEPLWAVLRARSEKILTGLWRRGALKGRKSEDAFFVRCDRTSMTQDDIDNGLVIVTIGVAPVRAAEFVILRIGQWTAECL